MTAQRVSDYELYAYQSYVPDFSQANLEWLNCEFDYEFGTGIDDESWWITEAVKTYRQAMSDELSTTPANAMHVVPLSGGLDSRAILGALLELLPRSQLVVATFGIPGSWDFEIPAKIASKYGLHHERLNLLDETWDLDLLAAAAIPLQKPVSVHQTYVRRKLASLLGKDCIFWSGWMGDILGGAFQKAQPSPTTSEVVNEQLRARDRSSALDERLRDAVADYMTSACPWDLLAQRKFNLDQQFEIAVRQNCLTGPIVMLPGFHFKASFLNRKWVNFMTNVPYKWRLDNKYLYKRMIRRAYPWLASLPSSSTAGMPVCSSKQRAFLGRAFAKVKPYVFRRDPYRSHPRTNYINWSESLRHKTPLQASVQATLEDLKKRGIFEPAEIDRWWKQHLERQANHDTLLMNLSSLELLLKAGKLSTAQSTEAQVTPVGAIAP